MERYDDKDSRLNWGTNGRQEVSVTNDFKGSHGYVYGKDVLKFRFNGSQIRIISLRNQDRSPDTVIIIDGISYSYSEKGLVLAQSLLFEKLNMEKGIHEVNIKKGASNINVCLDAIDIDETGYLVKDGESISLDKSSMNLNVDNSQQLTATTTPAGAEVVWTSSDETIATVDSTGKVTAIKVGQATITAQVKGSETKTTCSVTVTKSGTTTEPTTPTDPVSGTGLFIELVDGNIKQYDVSSDEITKFTNWYKSRDNDKSQIPYYKFTKGTYTDYVVHDKIDWFEIR